MIPIKLDILMFGYHGPANKKDGKLVPRLVIDYGNNINLEGIMKLEFENDSLKSTYYVVSKEI